MIFVFLHYSKYDINLGSCFLLTNHPGIPGLSREIQGFYPESRDFLAKSRDLESIYVVIDILLNAIEAKCMDNLLQKSFKHV